MKFKKYFGVIFVVTVVVFAVFSTNIEQAKMWKERSEKAFAQKNTAYGLLYSLRAERTAAIFERFRLIKARVLLDKTHRSDFQLASRVGVEFLVSFFTIISPLILQLFALIALFLTAFLIGSFGITSVVRGHKDLLLMTITILGFLTYSYRISGLQKAVILPASVTLSSGPGSNFAHIGALSGPQVVWASERRGDFVRIQSDSVGGWISSKYIKFV